MAKKKSFIDMACRKNTKIIYPNAKAKRQVRELIRREFSPQVKVESDPKQYLIVFCEDH